MKRTKEDIRRILEDPKARRFSTEGWEFRKIVASLTEAIPFGCAQMCGNGIGCCVECGNSDGYWRTSARKPPLAEIPQIVEHWAEPSKEGVGFWRRDKGCALPRSLRSTVCLSHFCQKAHLPQEYRVVLMFLRKLEDYDNPKRAFLVTMAETIRTGLDLDRGFLARASSDNDDKRCVLSLMSTALDEIKRWGSGSMRLPKNGERETLASAHKLLDKLEDEHLPHLAPVLQPWR